MLAWSDPNSTIPLDLIRALIELQRGFEGEILQPTEADERTLYCPDCGGKMTYQFSVLPYMMIPKPGAG